MGNYMPGEARNDGKSFEGRGWRRPLVLMASAVRFSWSTKVHAMVSTPRPTRQCGISRGASRKNIRPAQVAVDSLAPPLQTAQGAADLSSNWPEAR